MHGANRPESNCWASSLTGLTSDMPVDHSVSQAIRAHDAALNKLYFEHKETVEQLRHTLLTEILPNVVDELGLDNVARDWVEEWLQDDRRSPFLVQVPVFLTRNQVSIFRTLKVRVRRLSIATINMEHSITAAQVHKGIYARIAEDDSHLATDLLEEPGSQRLPPPPAPYPPAPCFRYSRTTYLSAETCKS